MGLSFIGLYSLQITRTGAAVAVSKLVTKLTLSQLFYIILTIILSGIISFFITISTAKFVSKHIHKFNYSKISIIILSILFTITIIFTGFIGLLIFLTATSLGITTILLGIKRMHLMGALLIPTILFYIF